MDKLKLFFDFGERILNTIWCCLRQNNHIIINSWMILRWGPPKCRNWGDELNFYLLHELTNKTIFNHSDLVKVYSKRNNNYLVIGSIIDGFCNSKSIIWGSGAIEGAEPLKEIPQKICAVRGKLTRDYLLKQGIECPDILGDPALLLPLIYKPQNKKKYRIGIIPHHSDLSDPIVIKLQQEGVKLIDMTDYSDWHQIIDDICSCESIISSSLHGLIVADAYRVPNIWVTIGGNLLGGTFKFLDYFSSVNRTDEEPIPLKKLLSDSMLESELAKYRYIDFNPRPLIEAAPWPLNLRHL